MGTLISPSGAGLLLLLLRSGWFFEVGTHFGAPVGLSRGSRLSGLCLSLVLCLGLRLHAFACLGGILHIGLLGLVRFVGKIYLLLEMVREVRPVLFIFLLLVLPVLTLPRAWVEALRLAWIDQSGWTVQHL